MLGGPGMERSSPWALCGVCALLFVHVDSACFAPTLRAFDATYQVRYKGVPGGTMTFSLRAGVTEGEYIYSVAAAQPDWFGQLALDPDARYLP
jgi:hypothetical protein